MRRSSDLGPDHTIVPGDLVPFKPAPEAEEVNVALLEKVGDLDSLLPSRHKKISVHTDRSCCYTLKFMTYNADPQGSLNSSHGNCSFLLKIFR